MVLGNSLTCASGHCVAVVEWTGLAMDHVSRFDRRLFSRAVAGGIATLQFEKKRQNRCGFLPGNGSDKEQVNKKVNIVHVLFHPALNR